MVMPVRKTIGIVGSRGYLGENLCNYLGSHFKIKRFSLSGRRSLSKSEITIYNAERITVEEIRDMGIDSLVICSSPSARECERYPLSSMKLVVDSISSFAQRCAQAGVRRIVYLSTARIYDQQEGIMREAQTLVDSSVYSISHLAGEKLMDDLCRQYGIEGISMRLANIFGTSLPISRSSLMWNLVANSIIADVASGKEVALLSPDAIREFVPINLFLHAVLQFITKDGHYCGAEVVNVGSGIRLRIRDMEKLVVRIWEEGKESTKVRSMLHDLKRTDVGLTRLDIDKAIGMGLYIGVSIEDLFLDDVAGTLG